LSTAASAALAAAPRAVVFAYHDVGVRCLRVLLAGGVTVPLVLTHADAAGEPIWFESVARHAAWHGIETLTPADPNVPEVIERVRALEPDFLFSFYYRALLGPQLLALPRRGAYNMHGSLLHGERETGATLHAMTAKPDAGDVVDRQAVPILPDDTAVEVFRKVTVAAEIVLYRSLPALLAGNARHEPQQLSRGSYFGRRTARDGAIDWRRGALAAHNLIRAVAPPYPGAFSRAAHPALAAGGYGDAGRGPGAALAGWRGVCALSRWGAQAAAIRARRRRRQRRGIRAPFRCAGAGARAEPGVNDR
jgi:methionyl-tRNA formyltransferase